MSELLQFSYLTYTRSPAVAVDCYVWPSGLRLWHRQRRFRG